MCLGLVMRHFNNIISGLEDDPRQISPYWSTMTYASDEREYDDAEMWACGFVEGMRLSWNDWKPLLSTPHRASLVQADSRCWAKTTFSEAQDELTETPGMRAELAASNPASRPGHACLLAATQIRHP